MNAVGFYEEVKTMEKKDTGRIKTIATKTLSDFIRLEEGSTGKQNALTAGAVLSGSVLAQVLFTTVESVEAEHVHSNNYEPASHSNNYGHTSETKGGQHTSAL